MSGALLKKELRANGPLAAIFLGVVTLYGSMITSMFDPKLGDSLNIMMESMPELFAAFGMSNPGASLTQFLANYLYGFLLIALPLVMILLLVQRLLVRYTDRGAMAAGQPHAPLEAGSHPGLCAGGSGGVAGGLHDRPVRDSGGGAVPRRAGV